MTYSRCRLSLGLLYGYLIQKVELKSASMNFSTTDLATTLGSRRKATSVLPRCFERMYEDATPPRWLAISHGHSQKTNAYTLRLAHSLFIASAPNVHKAPDRR